MYRVINTPAKHGQLDFIVEKLTRYLTLNGTSPKILEKADGDRNQNHRAWSIFISVILPSAAFLIETEKWIRLGESYQLPLNFTFILTPLRNATLATARLLFGLNSERERTWK